LGHIVPSVHVAWIWFMTISTQHVCVPGVQVAVPHAIPEPASPPVAAPSDADPSEPLAEASVPPLLDAPLLEVLLLAVPLLDVLVVPLLDVLVDPLLDVEPLDVLLVDVPPLPLLVAPLLDVELPDELPLFEPPELPPELVDPPPPSSPPPTVEVLEPLHATNPNKVPTRATTGSLFIVPSSRAGEIPAQAMARHAQWGDCADSLRLPALARRTGGPTCDEISACRTIDDRAHIEDAGPRRVTFV
jgi:hypothetical protein